MYPNVSEFNDKRCVCFTHLCTKTTITSSVNGRRFSVINYNDMDWTSFNLIYVLTWTDIICDMQYVGQTGWSLKTRFCEHFVKWKSLKYLTRFFIAISKIMVNYLVKLLFNQLKNIYMIQIHHLDWNIKSHETELKWIKFCNQLFL